MHNVFVRNVAISEHDLVNTLRPAELLEAELGNNRDPSRIP
jgi:hypothetical protein